MKEMIHIYHTNDLHSHLEHWPRIRDFLKKRKKWHEEEKDNVFLFDLGDHVDRWHPFTEGTLGKGNIALMNEVGYNAVTIGNNEGITLDHDDLDSLYDKAEFDVIIGNLYTMEKDIPSWVDTYKIYTTKSGMKIGVIGLTANFGNFYEPLGWKVTAPMDELGYLINKVKPMADYVILLSHLGIKDDEWIAEQFPEVDIILGAHTHHILREGKEVNNSLLGAAGKYGQFVGHIILEVDTVSKKLLSRQAQLYEHQELPKSPLEEREIENWFVEGKKLLDQPVAFLDTELKADWFQLSPLPQLLTDGLLEWCDADCAFLNAGLLLNGLSRGEVTKYDLHKILPHPINPCLIELTGAGLKEVIKQTFDEKWPHLQIKGLGFRGKVMGNFIYSGITIGSNGQTLRVQGNIIDPQGKYKLATTDMFTFGHFFPELHRASKKYFMPEFMRDILEWKLKR
jgi:5'-nucleotidase